MLPHELLPWLGVVTFGLGMLASVWFLIRTRRKASLGIITQAAWLLFSFVFWSMAAYTFFATASH